MTFINSYILKMDFVLTKDETQDILDDDPKNSKMIFPFLSSENVNTKPDHQPNKWIINF